MNDALLVAPLVIPLSAAVASLLAWGHVVPQRWIAGLGTGALLAAGLALLSEASSRGVLVSHLGGWPAPFGITLVADLFAAIMVCLAGLMGLAVAVYSPATLDPRREASGYYPMFHVLLMGVCGSFLTGDIFNLYVWFEVMLMSSFVLLVLGGERAQLEGGIKYVSLNLLSSALFLAAVGLLYGLAGTLNMADLGLRLARSESPGVVSAVAVLLLVAFGIKAAAFPLFFWLPAAYHTPPAAVSAIFAGLLTKVGVYALIRMFTLVFVQDAGFVHGLILGSAVLTMITGVLGAAAQMEFRRVLSFHIVSQIGYMLMGLGLFTPLAVAGSVFYLIHHVIVKTNLFLIAGLVQRARGTGDLRRLGGLWASTPLAGVLFLVPALSLAGIPPLSGFWAKLVLVRAGLEAAEYAVVAAALAVSLATLFSMTKIWAEAFWKPAPDGAPSGLPATPLLAWAPVVVLALVTLLIGLGAGPVFALSQRAATQLLDPAVYTAAVLAVRGGSAPRSRARDSSSDRGGGPDEYREYSRVRQRRAGGEDPLSARSDFHHGLLGAGP